MSSAWAQHGSAIFFDSKFAAKVFQALFIFTDISKFLLRAKNRGHFASHVLTTAVMQEMNVQMQLSPWSLSCPIKILKTGGGSGGRTLVLGSLVLFFSICP